MAKTTPTGPSLADIYAARKALDEVLDNLPPGVFLEDSDEYLAASQHLSNVYAATWDAFSN
jgi:hypothetical protein